MFCLIVRHALSVSLTRCFDAADCIGSRLLSNAVVCFAALFTAPNGWFMLMNASHHHHFPPSQDDEIDKQYLPAAKVNKYKYDAAEDNKPGMNAIRIE